MADFRYIVRIANSDLPGNKQIMYALCKIKGVSIMFSHAVCIATGIDKAKRTGELTELEQKKLDEAVRNPAKFGLPSWLYNRRHDIETGDDLHRLGSDLLVSKDSDIKRMKMIRSYRGVRHSFGLPVRGQRTKSNFRKNKRKGKGGSLGVRKAAPPPKAAPSEKGKA